MTARDSAAADADVMLRPEWQRGLREVGRGLLFELKVFPSQYRDALTMVDAFPDTRFVLLHAGMPADASAEGRRAWRAGLAEIARQTHVWVKLFGLGTFTRSCDQVLAGTATPLYAL